MWASAPTEWFLAVIYVIMVKNIHAYIVEKNPAKRFFDSLMTPGAFAPGVCYAFISFTVSMDFVVSSTQAGRKPARMALSTEGMLLQAAQ